MRVFKNAVDRISVQVKSQKCEFHPLWLRLNDPAGLTRNRQRLFEIRDVVENPSSSTAAHHHIDEARGLQVEWADGKKSSYPWNWLEAQMRANRLDPQIWQSGFRKFLPEVDFKDLASREGNTNLSAHLARYGLAILRNVPTDEGTVEKVGNMIGNVRHTNYGRIFDVIDKGADGNNLAQTNCQIPSHTDNPYRDPFPGVQLLHCLKNATDSGGATTFVDGFAAAESLRREDPAAFQLLADISHPWEYLDPETNVFLRTEVPVLSLDAHGQVVRVAFNNRSAAPLQGPMDSIDAYYRAWAKFDAICNADHLMVRVLLQPGDLAVFLNSRVMHGRDGYEQGGERHIQGTYVDHDAIFSNVSMALMNGIDLSRTCMHTKLTEECLEALDTQAQFSYGEGIDMLQHGLQVAAVAEERGESPDAVIACLLHDIGNTPQARQAWTEMGNEPPEMLKSEADGSIGFDKHSAVGAAYLESLGFSPEISSAVGLHVDAKRALVGMDPSYMKELSQASIDTLAHQGGPMNAEQLEVFHRTPGSGIALRLRHYDDLGKETDLVVPPAAYYRSRVLEHLRSQSMH